MSGVGAKLPPHERALLRARLILTRADSEPIEIMNAIVFLWWGIVLILPDTKPGDDSVLGPLLKLVSLDWIWGIVFVVVACWSIFGVLLDGASTRRLAMYVAVFWWTSFSIRFSADFGGATLRLGSGVALALLCMWAAWRVRPWEDDAPEPIEPAGCE